LSAEGAFKVGDVVRQKTAMLNAVVEKRYVVDGKVRYDIRDELQTVVERVGRDGEAGMNGLVKAEKGGYWPVVAERRE
jgi:superfamily II DNA/RNA helicase